MKKQSKENPYGMDWQEFRKTLEFTEEEEALMELEWQIIKATIEAREKNNMSQRALSLASGIAQPAIAKIEKQKNSPQINTLIKLLVPLGYTLEIVPLERN